MHPELRIAVLTPAVPERLAMLAETIASVNAQTLPPIAHLIEIDHERVGCATVQNRLLAAAVAADAEWVALLADDDIVYPSHLATLACGARNADIIYTWCEVTGRPGWNPNALFDAERLRRGNYIPSTTMIRTSLAVDLGWRPDAAHGFEDWDFWLRALAANARFVCIPEITWEYRFGHGTNISWP